MPAPRGAARLLVACGLLGMVVTAARGAGPAPAAVSAEEARELVRGGGPIVLDAVRSLAADAALSLAASGSGIALDGLPTLDPATAQALALHGKVPAELPEEFDIEALLARIGELAEGEDGWPDFTGLEELLAGLEGNAPDESAMAEGDPSSEAEDAPEAQPGTGDPWLSLGGLRSIGPDVAAALALHDGPLLLDGLESLSVESAEALAAHVGELSLAGLKSLPADVRDALANHDGPVVIPDGLVGD